MLDPQRCAAVASAHLYVYTPSPLYMYIFTRSHPQIYLSTSTHPHICTSISHLCIHTVTPSHPPSLSFFLQIFSLTSVHLHLHTLTSVDLPLHLHTSAHLYRTCTSTLSLLHIRPLFSLSTYLFSSYFRFNFFATSYSITDCIKKSWLLDNSILIVS